MCTRIQDSYNEKNETSDHTIATKTQTQTRKYFVVVAYDWCLVDLTRVLTRVLFKFYVFDCIWINWLIIDWIVCVYVLFCEVMVMDNGMDE